MRAEYIMHMGGDLLVANAARVSFDNWRNEFETGGHMGSDDRLIASLARDGHWSPFSHPQIMMRITAPVFLARQMEKHRIGLRWEDVENDPDIERNEVSRRYVRKPPEFWCPDTWRSRPAGSIKQGSGVPVDSANQILANGAYQAAIAACELAYQDLLEMGVAPEQARAVLPQSMYTQWIWTGSLAAFARVCNLRLDAGAQVEAQELARQISDIIRPLFPVSWAALVGGAQENADV